MGGKFGTKNTKDCLYLSKVVTLCILREVKKDGFQIQDLGVFLKSGEFEGALAEALKDIDQVPDEVTELDFRDGLDLGRYVYGMADDILDEVRALHAAKAAS